MKIPHVDKCTDSISNWIRIGDDIFNIIRGDVQFTVGSHATIYIKLDIQQNPLYYSFFIKKFEEQSNNYNKPAKEIKFDLYHRKFVARGTLIKTIDVSFENEMNLDFICDLLEEANLEERRDQIIGDILNETLLKDKDIT